MAFGESMLLPGMRGERFFNAIALNKVVLLTLSRQDFESAKLSKERKVYNERKDFLKNHCPTLHGCVISSKHSQKLCHEENMVVRNLIKGQVLFKEGMPNDKVYFVKSGELSVLKRVCMPKLDEEMEDTQKIFEDPSYIREMQKKNEKPVQMKHYIVGTAGFGNILGIEEAVFGQSTKYNTGVVCQTLKAELLEIDRELFEEVFRKYDLIWRQIMDKSAQNYASYIV